MTSAAPIRLLLADDHPLTLEGTALVLDAQPDLEVVAQAGDGRVAIELYRRHRPDVAILDLQMPGCCGVEATEAIRAEFPGARILLLTTFGGQEDVSRALRAGARSYLLKGAPKSELLAAIHAVHAGRRYLPAEIGEKLAEGSAAKRLTPREREILDLVVAGKANKEIAAELAIAEGTVKGHTTTIFQKLGVQSRTAAALEALRRGLIQRGR